MNQTVPSSNLYRVSGFAELNFDCGFKTSYWVIAYGICRVSFVSERSQNGLRTVSEQDTITTEMMEGWRRGLVPRHRELIGNCLVGDLKALVDDGEGFA